MRVLPTSLCGMQRDLNSSNLCLYFYYNQCRPVVSNIQFTNPKTCWKNNPFSVGRWVDFFFRVPIFILFLIIFFQGDSYLQTGFSSIVNVAGKTTAVGSYHFDWSVGESAAITTMGNSNLLVINGLLQYQIDN